MFAASRESSQFVSHHEKVFPIPMPYCTIRLKKIQLNSGKTGRLLIAFNLYMIQCNRSSGVKYQTIEVFSIHVIIYINTHVCMYIYNLKIVVCPLLAADLVTSKPYSLANYADTTPASSHLYEIKCYVIFWQNKCAIFIMSCI